MRRSFLLALVVGLTTVGCGSDSSTSPSSPSTMALATIQGTVNGDSAGAGPVTASALGVAATKAGIKVSVVGANLSTMSDSSGRFMLTGITTDHVILHFEGPGIDAFLEITGLVAGQTLTIKVRVSGSQADFDDDGSGSSPEQSKCFTAGEKAEVEGNISKKGSAEITVFQQGKGDYVCKVTASTSIRHGNTTFALADLKVGDHVHVSGKGLGSSAGACVVSAEEIKLQN